MWFEYTEGFEAYEVAESAEKNVGTRRKVLTSLLDKGGRRLNELQTVLRAQHRFPYTLLIHNMFIHHHGRARFASRCPVRSGRGG